MPIERDMIFLATPDPPSRSGTAPIAVVTYDYRTPAVRHGEPMKGYYFLCHVPVRGKRHCVLLRGRP
jgi:hypothetical protein